MKLPKKVEEQAKLAEDLHKQIYGNTPKEAPAEEPKVEPTAEPTARAPEPENAPAVAAPPVEDWEQKWRILSGKYNAEVPRMAAEIRELKGENARLQSEMESLQKARSTPPDIKPEEIERYGEDFVDFTKRVAQSVAPEVGEIKKTVEQLRSEQSRLARDRFFKDLKDMAPSWETLNSDEGFLTWLAETDPYTGHSRQELFDNAYSQWDAWRVANFFNSYGGTNKPAAVQQKPSLESQIVPSASRVESPPPAKNVYTVAQVQQFYRDVRERRYTPDEAARIEKDIFAAQAEGRLR